jgi:fucose permease
MLLFVIYCAFVSLGLPDALLGGAWPVMQPEFGVSYASAGWVSMTLSAGTILSSVFTTRLLKRFGIGRVVAASVALTAGALFGFASATSFAALFLAAVPLGLGAGAVDAGLNAFVAEHYASRHMSWLHSFWGLGALSGPFLLSAVLARAGSWRSGYLLIGSVQAALAVALLLILPVWGKVRRQAAAGHIPSSGAHPSLLHPLRVRGVKTALGAFFCYCGVEATLGLWGASFLVKARGLDAAAAARWVAGYYAGITAGRFLAGFLTYRVSNDNLIRSGCAAIVAGALLILSPLPFALAGFLLVGLGCAPVFPCMLHETPRRFGAGHSQAIMGFQMAVAYAGTTLLPPAFGFLAAGTSLSALPFFLLACAAVLAGGAEALRGKAKAAGEEKPD